MIFLVSAQSSIFYRTRERTHTVFGTATLLALLGVWPLGKGMLGALQGVLQQLMALVAINSFSSHLLQYLRAVQKEASGLTNMTTLLRKIMTNEGQGPVSCIVFCIPTLSEPVLLHVH